MSTNKPSKPKKRKITDLEDAAAPHKLRKLRNVQSGRATKNHNDEPKSLDSVEDMSHMTPFESDSEIRARQQKRKTQRLSRETTTGQATVEEALQEEGTVVGAAEETGAVPITQSHNAKWKAAARQAKSERRAKKKSRPEGAADLAEVETKPDIENKKSSTSGEPKQSIDNSLTSEEPGSDVHPSKPKPKPKPIPSKQRFILFIGNLPFTTTTKAIEAHFSKLLPFTVRHSTEKGTGKSKGFAFIEFEGFDKMKTCLKLYHHSLFDPGAKAEKSSHGVSTERRKSQVRKINVELTAGGGGKKSEGRKEKIKGKNEKLEEERERRRIHGEKEAAAKRKKSTENGASTGANAIEVSAVGDGGDAEDKHIHPSRRKRMRT